jgi:hypothetical protein
MPDLDHQAIVVGIEAAPDLPDAVHGEGALVPLERLDAVSDNYFTLIPFLYDLAQLINFAFHHQLIGVLLSRHQVDGDA